MKLKHSKTYYNVWLFVYMVLMVVAFYLLHDLFCMVWCVPAMTANWVLSELAE